MELISVIVPCYNEEESLPLFYREITAVADGMKDKNFKDGISELEFEFVFINDGSRDKTLSILREMAENDRRVCYVSFSRNFGKEAAMLAGLEKAKGDYCVILDADLQHPPRLIPQMYDYVRSGEYDCAATRRVSRKGESKLLSFFARSFYKIINKISQTHIVDGAQDFRFMTRQMVNAILDMPESCRFSKGIFSWVGFETKFIEVENTQRAAGKSAWNFKKLFLYSVEGFLAFTTAPLAAAFLMGVVMLIAAAALYIIAGVNMWENGVILGTVCLIGAVQLFCAGLLGLYISKMYTEIKRRPRYIVKETEEALKARKRDIQRRKNLKGLK